ncbi:MAG: Fe-S cluster assembly ATPase SufC [candidate division Zixibacteria bacterium]|nr:Fe-S cluster assembly ATPase SufC [candidate division Zixibacteria bacterium]
MKDKPLLEIRNLEVSIEGKRILNGVGLSVKAGEIHAIMGPNGSGKSTLCYALAGHPEYAIMAGEAYLDGKNLLEMEPEDRSRAGLFLAFQYPVEVPGVTLQNFLRTAYNAHHDGDGKRARINVLKFWNFLREKLQALGVDESFANRYLNDGFSGGEKKRAEILQMAVLEPKVAFLDETDSGLDIDALKAVADGVNKLMNENMAVVVITHYQRLLNYIKPDFVHIMSEGRIIKTGGPELALELEDKGYGWITETQVTAEV